MTPLPRGARLLVATLLLRAFVNGALAVWLLARDLVWIDIFWTGAAYAIIDGGLGILTGALLTRHEWSSTAPQLVSMVLADAVLRVGAGLAIFAFPGIPDFPITLVLFFGALGAWAAIAGVIAIVGWFAVHEREKNSSHRPRSRTHALFDPLAAAGVVALMLAVYAVIVGPPATDKALRVAAGVASGSLVLVFLVAAFSVARAGRAFSGTARAGARR
jgi:hypothetical protein